MPNAAHPGIVAFTQVTGVASRMIGYCIGLMFIAVAFIPKVSALLSTLPGPVMTGYLIMVTGTLFVDGARTVISTEQVRQRLIVAGVAFWIAAPFQFKLFTLPNVETLWGGEILDGLLSSGITTGGIAAIVMLLFLEFTSRKGMRFESRLHADSLPELNEFITRFADRRGWDDAMKDRLNAVAEETLLTLAPLDLFADDDEEDDGRGWSCWRPATAPWLTWSSWVGATPPISRTGYGSSSSTTRRYRPRTRSRCDCCGNSPRPSNISSTTTPTSSRSGSVHRAPSSRPSTTVRGEQLRIVDEGIISRRPGRHSYMPGIEPVPDGSFIACQFTASHFTASDARIEILRSTDGLATWTNEGEIKGPGAAEEGWSYRGARIYGVPGGRLLMKTTRFDTGQISETFDASSETLAAAREHHSLVRRRGPHMVCSAAR